MNYALLDPQIIYQNDSNLQIVQYVETTRGQFDVCPPFYWVECPNENITAYQWYYDISDGNFYEISMVIPPIETIK